MKTIRIALALALGLAGRVALADDEGPMHEHHGFYLHLEGGIGGLSSSTNRSPRLTLSGGGGSLAISFGGSIGPVLALSGEVWDLVAIAPDVKYGSSTASTSDDDSFALVGFGPKVTFYIAPEHLNMYVSATPSLTQCTLDVNGEKGSTRDGLGLRLALGKEWWLGHSQWGIGVAGQLVLASNKDKGSGAPTWSTVGGGINFSATWN